MGMAIRERKGHRQQARHVISPLPHGLLAYPPARASCWIDPLRLARLSTRPKLILSLGLFRIEIFSSNFSLIYRLANLNI